MLGQPILRLDEVDSTNRVALDWEDAPHGAAVVARSQSGGRGRLGRNWSSPRDTGLYLSVVLLPEQLENNTAFSLLVALAVAQALEKTTALKIGVKWPNDVLCVRKNGKALKIGGILCESRGPRIVVGIGVNLNQSEEELPPRPIFEASSLQIETGRPWSIDAVLNAILEELDAVLSSGWDAQYRDFVRHCYGIGEVVRVKAPTATTIGIFEAVGENGSLLLRTSEGLKEIVAGDISYL
ncbi:biotin--[acetyl-CoA-carboxylase] ligase [bacterium]|nr:MAG: biotin--[acetyl-CoA-carboxylase] ligase [bacterium]